MSPFQWDVQEPCRVCMWHKDRWYQQIWQPMDHHRCEKRLNVKAAHNISVLREIRRQRDSGSVPLKSFSERSAEKSQPVWFLFLASFFGLPLAQQINGRRAGDGLELRNETAETKTKRWQAGSQRGWSSRPHSMSIKPPFFAILRLIWNFGKQTWSPKEWRYQTERRVRGGNTCCCCSYGVFWLHVDVWNLWG